MNGIDVDGGRAFLATTNAAREFLVLNVAVPSAITVASFAGLLGSPPGRDIDSDQGRLYGVTDNGGTDPDFFVWSVGE